jgi:hypothetical protein
MNKFYIVDSGRLMTHLADAIMLKLKAEGNHYVNYITDQDYYLAVEEITEDEFLDHIKNMNK